MLESLKSLWARWSVQISFVGGALVCATAYGTCTFDPQQVSEEVSDTPTQEVSAETTVTTEASVTETEANTELESNSTDESTNTTGE